jgi:hypothetical protein
METPIFEPFMVGDLSYYKVTAYARWQGLISPNMRYTYKYINHGLAYGEQQETAGTSTA